MISEVDTLSFRDTDFIEKVAKDLNSFLKLPDVNQSVLVFPAINSYLRYLIHDIVSDTYTDHDLVSFSVGQGSLRRTIACKKFAIEAMETRGMSNVTTNNRNKLKISNHYIPPHARKLIEEETKKNYEFKDETKAKDPTVKLKKEKKLKSSSKKVDKIAKESGIDLALESVKSEPNIKVKTNCVDKNEPKDLAPDSVIVNELKDAKSLALNSVKSRIPECNEYFPKPSSASDSNLTVDDSDWDTLYDDGGECLASSIIEEITKKVGKVKIKQPKESFTDDGDEKDEIGSIVEIYGFSEEIRTNDLITIFGSYVNRGFNLKWVDNTHALGVCSSPLLAEEILSANLPMVKTRPLSKATPQSQSKAKNFTLSSALRPKTCSVLARRLVSGALGLKVNITPEKREAEKEILREARESKKQAAKDRDAAWEGKF